MAREQTPLIIMRLALRERDYLTEIIKLIFIFLRHANILYEYLHYLNDRLTYQYPACILSLGMFLN
jgi:hypothetical protein